MKLNLFFRALVVAAALVAVKPAAFAQQNDEQAIDAFSAEAQEQAQLFQAYSVDEATQNQYLASWNECDRNPTGSSYCRSRNFCQLSPFHPKCRSYCQTNPFDIQCRGTINRPFPRGGYNPIPGYPGYPGRGGWEPNPWPGHGHGGYRPYPTNPGFPGGYPGGYPGGHHGGSCRDRWGRPC